MNIVYTNRVKLELREQLTNAALFYADKLGISKELQSKITLNIFVRKSEDRGSCEVALGAKNPKNFDIILNPYEEESILQTLAHEMVHLKQFATGELRMMSKCSKWKGEVWKNKTDEMDDYYDSPWEIEAFGREQGLFLRYACAFYGDD